MQLHARLRGVRAPMSQVRRRPLRSLNLQVYIEKWLQIIERCTGIVPPCPGPVILERLDQQFIELEKPS